MNSCILLYLRLKRLCIKKYPERAKIPPPHCQKRCAAMGMAMLFRLFLQTVGTELGIIARQCTG